MEDAHQVERHVPPRTHGEVQLYGLIFLLFLIIKSIIQKVNL